MQKKPTVKSRSIATKAEIAEKFGRWIKDKRRDARLAQHTLALRSGMSRGWVARIESGEIPSREKIVNLAHALNVPEREALARAGLGTGLEAEEIPLSYITYKMLSPRSREIIDRHIDELRGLEESVKAWR